MEIITLNHKLSDGDKELYQTQLMGRNATFQFTQTGITATTVKIELYMRAHRDMPWILLDDATLTIDPTKPSDFMRIQQPASEHVLFKLVTGTATKGVINQVFLAK